jgi:hypothetical protein
MRRLTLLLALAAGMALLSASRLPAPPLPTGTTSLGTLDKYLIDDVTLVGVANVKTIAASPLHAKLKKQVAALAEHELFAKHLKLFGVKLVQDVERGVLVMGEGKVRELNFKEKARPENEDRFYFLFQGKFDAKKFEAGFAQIAKEHERAKLHGKGRTAILESGGKFVCLLDSSTVIVGPSKKLVEDVQGRASGKVKAKFKVKDLPAALKALKSDVPIDAVGFGALPVSSKFERLEGGAKITPVTLDNVGFSKLTVRVEAKDGLKGRVAFEGKGKDGFAKAAKTITDGLEEMKKRGDDRPTRDPLELVARKVLKAVKAKTANQALTLEGEVSQEDVKSVLDTLKKELDDEARPHGGR